MTSNCSGLSRVKNELTRCQVELETIDNPRHSALIREYITDMLDFLRLYPSIMRDEPTSKEKYLLGETDPLYVMIANKIILYSSYLENVGDIENRDLPDGVVSYLNEDFERSLKLACANDMKVLSFSNVQFKIYADTLNFQLMPVGNQDIALSGLSRSWVVQPSLRNSLGFLLLLLRLGGNRPLYEMHFNPHRMRLFTEDGWEGTFRLIAQVIARKPAVKGVFGGSWFFDPDVLSVSPELSYLHSMVKRLGGTIFFSSMMERDKTNAFAMSAKRRRAYEEGKYNPKSYVAIIPRNSILNFYGIPDHASSTLPSQSQRQK